MAKTYTIDPLVWVDYGKGKSPYKSYCSDCIFGQFTLWWCGYQKSWRLDWCFEEYYDEGSELCDSFNQGKEVATALFMHRLLPALTEVS